MKTLKKMTINGLLMIFIIFTVMTSCSENEKISNNRVIENSYTGSITDLSTESDPDGNFSGNGDSGTYSFAWVNAETKAKVKFDITATEGTLQVILNDDEGKEVFNQTLTGGSNVDSHESISDEGNAGTWKVTLIFTNFNGSGSYELDPGD